MIKRKSEAIWEGNLKNGKGIVKSESGALNIPYGFRSRFENGPGTNPEELIAAAHAGCFSMALAAFLEKGGYPPEKINTQAEVSLKREGEGFRIPGILLRTKAKVPNIDKSDF